MTDENVFSQSKALFHTFGCKLNFAETSTVAKIFADHGIRRVQRGEVPDIVVVNTCSVTEIADKKCRQIIRSFARKYPNAKILVTGCYAQLKPSEVASLPGVVVVAGINDKLKLLTYLQQWQQTSQPLTEVPAAKDLRSFMPSCSRGDRTRYFLKVQDGCDYWCTYCTIPKARGRSRSGTIEQILEQVRDAAANGAKEIVITGVNIGDFGKGTEHNFLDLIKKLDQVEGIQRYRISSIEPNLLTDEIIEWVAQSKRFMPHFHIPLQCGDDQVLKLMHRHYDTALFASKIQKIRETIPDAFIGVDLIVGARGETQELFENSKGFCDSLDITRLHVFTYSERPGTKALEIPHVVSQEERHQRTNQMLRLSEAKMESFLKKYLGQVRPVLLEHGVRKADTHQMSGFTDNYIKVQVTVKDAQEMERLDNAIVNVRLLSLGEDGETVKGEIVRTN